MPQPLTLFPAMQTYFSTVLKFTHCYETPYLHSLPTIPADASFLQYECFANALSLAGAHALLQQKRPEHATVRQHAQTTHSFTCLSQQTPSLNSKARLHDLKATHAIV
jgi:hypothetical protein